MSERFSGKNACAPQDFLYYMQNNVFYMKHLTLNGDSKIRDNDGGQGQT